VRFARDAIKSARKANRKIVAAKAAGSARAVSLVLATVLPLMETMAKDAAERALDHVASVRAKVATEGLDAAYPEPVRLTTNEQWNRSKRAEYDRANARRAFAARIQNDEFVANYVEGEVYGARMQFLGFANKLETKVGAITSAELEMVRGVWGESYLRVTTTDGARVTWKTQTIVNRSVLDNLFYQWPTRVVKM
jgi:hypothetical protein